MYNWLKRFLQFSEADDSVGCQVKRVQLDRNNRDDIRLKGEGRLFSLVEFSLPKTSHSTDAANTEHDNFTGNSVITAYYNLEIDDKKKTTAVVVEETA